MLGINSLGIVGLYIAIKGLSQGVIKGIYRQIFINLINLINFKVLLLILIVLKVLLLIYVIYAIFMVDSGIAEAPIHVDKLIHSVVMKPVPSKVVNECMA